VAQFWGVTALAAVVARTIKVVPLPHPITAAVVILGSYGLTFFAVTFALCVPEASSTIARMRISTRSR
jgi:hypothetical protein